MNLFWNGWNCEQRNFVNIAIRFLETDKYVGMYLFEMSTVYMQFAIKD